ncbi:MAG: hypothetical protein Q8Q15_00845, partial [bacterium]|nr:hypothetical protein [bacterium]
ILQNKLGINFLADTESRYVDFVFDYLEKRFEGDYEKEWESLKERFSDYRASIIYMWLTFSLVGQFTDSDYVDTIEKEINSSGKKRIKELMKEFLLIDKKY